MSRILLVTFSLILICLVILITASSEPVKIFALQRPQPGEQLASLGTIGPDAAQSGQLAAQAAEHGRHHNRRDLQANPINAAVVRQWNGPDYGPGGKPSS